MTTADRLRVAQWVYLIGMGLVLIFAVGFTAMTRHLPNPGAFYAYTTAGLGRAFGLGAAFTASYGYLLLLLAVYPYFGVALNTLVTGTFGGPAIAWYWYSLLALAGVSVLGYFNVDLSTKVLSILLLGEVLIVVIYDVAIVGNGGAQGLSLAPFAPSALQPESVGIAVLFAVTSFLGFEATAIYREEARDPEKTIPRATYLAVLFIGLFYTLEAWLLIVALGPDHATAAVNDDPAGVFLDTLGSSVGKLAVDIASALLVTSFFACLLSMHNVMARNGFSLGVDGVLPRRIGVAHPRHTSPHVASLLVSSIVLAGGAVIVALGSDPVMVYGRLAGTGGFVIVILMLLTSVAVLRFFHRSNGLDHNWWRTLVAPAVSVLGMGGVLYLAVTHFTLPIGGSGTEAALLQALTWGVILGGMLVALVLRKRRPQVYQKIGRQWFASARGLEIITSGAAAQPGQGGPHRLHAVSRQPAPDWHCLTETVNHVGGLHVRFHRLSDALRARRGHLGTRWRASTPVGGPCP